MHFLKGYCAVVALIISLVVASYYINCPTNCKCECDEKECSVDCSGMTEEKINFTKFKDLPPIPINLRLENCQLRRIPKEIYGLNIKSLDLSHNNIHVIQKDDISKLSALEDLDLSYNYVNEKISLQSTSLKTLKISNNDIKTITKSSFECPQLTFLDLNHNKIKDLSDDILPDNLETLLISNNSIEHLGLSFPNLKKLYISNNKMSELKITGNMMKLEKIWMKGNRFQFDCNDADFKKLHQFLQGKIQDSSYDECLKDWYPHTESDLAKFWVRWVLQLTGLVVSVCIIWAICGYIIKTMTCESKTRGTLTSNQSSARLIPDNEYENETQGTLTTNPSSTNRNQFYI